MSSLIKANFVSFSEHKRTIETVSKNNYRILNPVEESAIDENEGIADDATTYEESEDFSNVVSIQDKAKIEAEAIIQQAMQEAEQIRKEAYDKGYNEGFSSGKTIGLEQVNDLKAQLQEEIANLRSEKEELFRDIEPKVAEIIQSIVSNIIGVSAFEDETILFLIRKGLEEAQVHDGLVIRVSAEDYDYVLNNKQTITQNFSDKIDIEILKDVKLSKMDCIIETNLGSIHCGLGVKTEGLMRQLMLIQKSLE